MLTLSERENLHLALLAYLNVEGYQETYDKLSSVAAVTKTKEVIKNDYKKVIPTNWRAIVKLRRKITGLEDKNKQLKDEIENFGKKKVSSEDADPMPRKPARHCFTKQKQVITCVDFHPKYSSLASASEDSSIVVYNADSGESEMDLRGHQDAVNCCTFHPNQEKLASCSADMSIKFWDLEEGKCTKTIIKTKNTEGHDHNVSCVRYTTDGKYLLSSSRDTTIRKWKVSTGQCAFIYGLTNLSHTGWVRCLGVHPNGDRFASAGSDSTIKVWPVAGGKPLFTISEAHPKDKDIECLLFSNADADKIIIKSMQGEAQKAEKILLADRTQFYKQLSAKGDEDIEDKGGAFLFSGSRDKDIACWSSSSGTLVWRIPKAHNNWVRDLVIHPTGKYIVSCSDDKSIKVWDITGTTPKNVHTMKGAHELFITSLSWCQSMDFLASGGVDCKVTIWDCPS